jgi:hypothetical protein
MKRTNFILIALFIINNLFAQNSIKTTSSIEITEINKSIIEIANKVSGLKSYKNVGNIKPVKKFSLVDTTRIDLSNINDSLYSQMYELWFETNISGQSFRPAPIADIDNDGNPEIYGHFYETAYGSVIKNGFAIYEYNPILNHIILAHNFSENDSLLEVGGYYGGDTYDIDQDGKENICLVNFRQEPNSEKSLKSNKYYEGETTADLPTKVDFDYHEDSQCNNYTYGDFDKNGIVDLVYFRLNPATVKIVEYNNTIHNFDSTFSYPLDVYTESYGGGFSVEDIDNDGYPEIGFGTIKGNLYLFEFQESTQKYEMIFHDSLGIPNLYLHFSTNDLDGNGKKEFWVGGDYYYDWQGITRFFCYESIGNNQYEQIHIIEIQNLFSDYAGNMFPIDIDKDGIEEIFMCVDQNILVFKFNGSPNNPSYELYYHWHNPKANDEDWGYIYGAKMYDINNDGFEEIIINGKSNTKPSTEDFRRVESYIFKPTEIVSVKQKKETIKSFELYQNYPNPFNPTTKIDYSIPIKSFVNISVYNILGEKVSEIYNLEQPSGSYNITFSGVSLPSGVYFINLTAKTKNKEIRKTIKSLLIK